MINLQRVSMKSGEHGRSLRFEPLTSENWNSLVKLFGTNGACGGCWCMWWKKSASEFGKCRGDRNKRALRKLIGDGCVPGILAYADGEPVGWCAIEPRECYPRLAKSRVLAPVDSRSVWSVACIFIKRGWRRQGLSTKLIVAAVEWARTQGATIVEGYPCDWEGRPMWTGPLVAFERAGFKEVARRSASRPIVRRILRKRAQG